MHEYSAEQFCNAIQKPNKDSFSATIQLESYTKFNFGMIPVAIWYEYHTSLFAVL